MTDVNRDILTQLQNANGQLKVLDAKNRAANQLVGNIIGENIELRAGNMLLGEQMQQMGQAQVGMQASIDNLQKELKAAQPEDVANQIIDLNNQIATLRQDNERMVRVTQAFENEVLSLRDKLGIKPEAQNEENADANGA